MHLTVFTECVKISPGRIPVILPGFAFSETERKTMIPIVIVYLLIVNITAFALMGVDKRRAVRHAWRIPESALFGWAIAGGSVGAILGMYLFRHKTRHWYFKYGLPAILAVQAALLICIPQMWKAGQKLF